jgi:outer membrane protein assembly factor BamB
MSNKKIRLLLAMLTIFLLAFSVNTLTLNASTKKVSMNLNPIEEVGPEDNLYKYLYHVNVTQYPWSCFGYNGSQTGNNPHVSAPTTNHLLWRSCIRPYEALAWRDEPKIVAGKVIASTSQSFSIYDDQHMLYAFDQNNGRIMWTYRGLSGGTVLDDTHYLSGTTMINPDTGAFMYKVPAGLGIYVPEIRMGFRESGGAVEGWDWSNLKNPERLWRSKQYEYTECLTYSNGKVFWGGGLGGWYHAADAMTGEIIWDTIIKVASTRGWAAGYGKIFIAGYDGVTAIDQATGKLLWFFPQRASGFNSVTIGDGKVYANDINYYVYCWNADTGEVIWRYLAERKSPFPAGPDPEQWRLHDMYIYSRFADHKLYLSTLSPTRYGTPIPPNWVSEDSTMWNPHDYTVVGQSGTAEFCCLDAEHGTVIWRSGVEEVGSPGPHFPTNAVTDGRVYASLCTMTGHIGVLDARPYTEFGWDRVINYEWFPGSVWCYGPGPSQLKDVTLDQYKIMYSNTVTISGKLVDLSPAIKPISYLSDWERKVGDPAPGAPVTITWSKPDGTNGEIALVKTDEDGKFSYTWAPWLTGEVSIHVGSDGGPSYEAPNTVTVPLFIEAKAADLVPILQGALIGAIIVAVALPIVIFVTRKPK